MPRVLLGPLPPGRIPIHWPAPLALNPTEAVLLPVSMSVTEANGNPYAASVRLAESFRVSLLQTRPLTMPKIESPTNSAPSVRSV